MITIRVETKYSVWDTHMFFNDKNRNFWHIWTCHHSAVTERERQEGTTNREGEREKEAKSKQIPNHEVNSRSTEGKEFPSFQGHNKRIQKRIFSDELASITSLPV